MTDEPTKNPSDQPPEGLNQPTQPADPTTPPPPPPASPSQPSGVGFAAIHLPGQQTPSQPLPGQAPGYANPYQPPAGPPPAPPAGPPPGPPTNNSYNPPPPPGPVYQYDISRMPNQGGGPPLLLIGILGFVLVLVVGVGAMLAFGVGPFARPTPVPTLVAQPTPTARPASPTPRPSTTASASATPLPSPTDGGAPTLTPTEALLSHIPEAIRATCFVSEPGSDSTIIALATCSADDGNIQLTYFQYDSHDSMFLPYEGFRLASQIEPDTGDCNDHASWPAENGFNIGGQPAGRWLCTEALGQTSIYWTDDRLSILSQATQTEPDYPRLIDFWVHESGPEL